MINAKFPFQMDSTLFTFMEMLAPQRLFHPTRDVASVSTYRRKDLTSRAHKRPVEPKEEIEAHAMALCLLGSSRPIRPSYNCPVGCPHHDQNTCAAVNCMWDGSGNYLHASPTRCLDTCMRYAKEYDFGYACPVDFTTEEKLAEFNSCSKETKGHPCYTIYNTSKWRPTLPVGRDLY